jgi:hypothetical protein
MNAPTPSTITLLVCVPLIAWRVYRRSRRLIGRQQLTGGRPWVTIAVYTLLLGLLGTASRVHPELVWWLAGGVGLGAVLGLFGLSRTRFEATAEGLFYTPHAHLGIALSLLLVARIGYRFIQLSFADPGLNGGNPDFTRGPATLGLIGLLAGYYVTYSIGQLRWRFGIKQSKI